MERQTYTNTNRYLFLFLIALMVSCSKNDIQIAKSLNKEITIYPKITQIYEGTNEIQKLIVSGAIFR